ncbi:unnamed protein product, partial [Rotaria sp. Silwood1]
NRQNEEEILSKIIQNLERIKEQRLKLNQLNNKKASTYIESSEHYEAIRSGDYYMFNYEIDKVNKEKNNEPTLVEEQKISLHMDEITNDNHSNIHGNLSLSEPIHLSKCSLFYRLLDS